MFYENILLWPLMIFSFCVRYSYEMIIISFKTLQNPYIFFFKWPSMTFDVKFQIMKNMRLVYYVSILTSFQTKKISKSGFLEKKIYLMWPLMTSKVILYLMQNLRFLNVSIHSNFHQKFTFCDLECPLRSYFIIWKICVKWMC